MTASKRSFTHSLTRPSRPLLSHLQPSSLQMEIQNQLHQRLGLLLQCIQLSRTTVHRAIRTPRPSIRNKHNPAIDRLFLVLLFLAAPRTPPAPPSGGQRRPRRLSAVKGARIPARKLVRRRAGVAVLDPALGAQDLAVHGSAEAEGRADGFEAVGGEQRGAERAVG